MARKQQKNSRDKNFSILGIVVFFIIAAIIKNILVDLKTTSYSNDVKYSYSDDTKYKSFNVSIDSNYNIKTKVHDKILDEYHETNENVSAPLRNFENANTNVSAANKQYYKQNYELVKQASMAYGFILAMDYKLVRYCANYHPVNNVKRKFDARFKEKKIKAIGIINKAYGETGAKNFEKYIIADPNSIKSMQEQIERDYQASKKVAQKSGITNFTRQKYCKVADDNADYIVENDYELFKKTTSNF